MRAVVFLLLLLNAAQARADAQIYPFSEKEPLALRVSRVTDHGEPMLRYQLCFKKDMNACMTPLGGRDYPESAIVGQLDRMATSLTQMTYGDYVTAMFLGWYAGFMVPRGYNSIAAKFATTEAAEAGTEDSLAASWPVFAFLAIGTTAAVGYGEFNSNRKKAIQLVRKLSLREEGPISWDTPEGMDAFSREIDELLQKALSRPGEA
jgi:hypothetical protein